MIYHRANVLRTGIRYGFFGRILDHFEKIFFHRRGHGPYFSLLVSWVILGGRLGYVLFYDFGYYLSHPVDVLRVWKGGMSFHGGTIGVLLAMWYVSKTERISYLRIADSVTSVLPIGLGLGRVANFLNNELYGYAPYDGPFAMYVTGVGHFPSPLLEALLEGPILFCILFYVAKKFPFPGSVSSSFLVTYAIFRISVEFVRLPDVQLGYFFSFVTMGQLLSLPMLVA